jgi:RNA recognition motif-containing protein
MTRLYVGNIRYSADEAALRAAFEPFGPVKEVFIGIDRETGRSRGFAFVTMADDASAIKARDGLNGKELDGRALVVKEAQPRAARALGPERSSGGSGGSDAPPRRERSDQAAGFRGGGHASGGERASARGGFSGASGGASSGGPQGGRDRDRFSGRSGDREVNRARERERERDRDRVRERDKQKFDRDDDW